MQARDVLSAQLNTSFNLITEHATSAAADWTSRAFADASLPGFILWHCTRIIDWAVHTGIRRVPEIADSDMWRERIRHDLGHGAGLTATEADSVAASVNPDDVIAYAEALRPAVLDWLSNADEQELERTVDLRVANAGHPRYETEAAWQEVAALDGLPAWQLLSRPSFGHIREHMGEVENLRAVLAARPASA